MRGARWRAAPAPAAPPARPPRRADAAAAGTGGARCARRGVHGVQLPVVFRRPPRAVRHSVGHGTDPVPGTVDRVADHGVGTVRARAAVCDRVGGAGLDRETAWDVGCGRWGCGREYQDTPRPTSHTPLSDFPSRVPRPRYLHLRRRGRRTLRLWDLERV